MTYTELLFDVAKKQKISIPRLRRIFNTFFEEVIIGLKRDGSASLGKLCTLALSERKVVGWKNVQTRAVRIKKRTLLKNLVKGA